MQGGEVFLYLLPDCAGSYSKKLDLIKGEKRHE